MLLMMVDDDVDDDGDDDEEENDEVVGAWGSASSCTGCSLQSASAHFSTVGCYSPTGDDGDGGGSGGDGGSGGHGDNDDDEENYFLKDEIEGKTNACHSITPTSTLERLYEVVLELIFEESF